MTWPFRVGTFTLKARIQRRKKPLQKRRPRLRQRRLLSPLETTSPLTSEVDQSGSFPQRLFLSFFQLRLIGFADSKENFVQTEKDGADTTKSDQGRQRLPDDQATNGTK